MNYKKHYSLLIERGKHRVLSGYYEKHHILPKCINGSDDKNNIVHLTAREHFIAHLLLLKIYPGKFQLIKAVQMMCVASSNQHRSMNRMYGWLKEEYSKVQSINQTGKGNSQYGTRWIYNLDLKASKKIPKNDPLPSGWNEGRKIKFNKINIKCNVCGNSFKQKYKEKICSDTCRKQTKPNQTKDFYEKLDTMIANCNKGMSIYQSLKSVGFCGTGSAHRRLKNIIEKE